MLLKDSNESVRNKPQVAVSDRVCANSQNKDLIMRLTNGCSLQAHIPYCIERKEEN